MASLSCDTIYFISDTHLGDGSQADRFRYPEQLHDLLVRIESEPDAQVVLLGDFLELWSASLEAVLVHRAPVVRRVAALAATHPVTYIVGNHDCLPWYYYLGQSAGKITVAERFSNPQGNLLALHGHQFDPFNAVKVEGEQVKVPWTRKLVEVIGLAERVGGEPVADAVANLGEAVDHAAGAVRDIVGRESPGERGYPEGERVYEEAAHSLMRGQVQYVVMGHTHHPLTRTYGARKYINTGSWVWDRYPPTYGRYAAGILELLDATTHRPYKAP